MTAHKGGGTRRDGQHERMLSKLFYDKRFVAEIEALRTAVGIPINGFRKFEDYYHFLERDSGWNTWFVKIQPEVYKLPFKYLRLPGTNYADSVEAFLALGYGYRKFEHRLPFNYSRDHIVSSKNVALNPQTSRDDHISLDIYAGSSQREVKDFISQHWGTIASALDAKQIHGSALAVRNVGNRDAFEVLRLVECGDVDLSTGVYNPMRHTHYKVEDLPLALRRYVKKKKEWVPLSKTQIQRLVKQASQERDLEKPKKIRK